MLPDAYGIALSPTALSCVGGRDRPSLTAFFDQYNATHCKISLSAKNNINDEQEQY